jgi:HPt (histidine-containing phosphotransfer) domain-containing protein
MQADDRAEPQAQAIAALSTVALPELDPIYDAAAFESVAAIVSPAVVAAYVTTLAERCDSLLRQLRASPPLPAGTSELAAAAHALGGSAGLFGFRRLAIAAYTYERSLEVAPASAPSLAADLIAVIETSLVEMHRHLRRSEHDTPGPAERT